MSEPHPSDLHRPETTQRPHSAAHAVRLFAAHVLHMPLWQKALLALAVIAIIVGPFAAVRQQPKHSQQQTVTRRTAPGSSYVGGESTTATPDDTTPATTPAPSSWMSRVGISIVLGFIIGWLFRTFVRFMALVAILFGGLLTALSYFHVVNVDLTTAANQRYHDATAWITDQAGKLKDVAKNQLPSTTGGFVGIFMGFRRRS